MTIAILTGGNVAERGVSLRSTQTVEKFLDKSKYNVYVIELNGQQFQEQKTGEVLDMRDFSLVLDGQKITFDLVFLMLHGHPAENGSILGYFELVGIPCTGCDHLVSALTFNKQLTKDFLRPHSVPMVDSQLLRKGQTVGVEAIEKMGFPLFVKPNKNGSSFGITKVNQADEILPAVEKSFQFDDEVIVEQFMEGQEFSNGVYRKGQEVIVLPITEIRTDNEFFDYKAKYENESVEITPAEISEALTEQCQRLTKKIYELLNCKGVCRVDYILMNGLFHFLEINTIPGMTEPSFIPQQVAATVGVCLIF
ncbi:MAG: D-alanine--D-alanine ligase [Bacteroidota bacterium]